MEITRVMSTGAGMFGLWSPGFFSGVVDQRSWASALREDEDIARHIAVGAFVPVNIGTQGAFQVVVRTGSGNVPAQLTDRERRYTYLSSEPYLFISNGGAMISGLEHIGATADLPVDLPLQPGRWQVTVSAIEWNAEPGQQDDAGRPAPTALSDFILLLSPEVGATRYRTMVQTFDLQASRPAPPVVEPPKPGVVLRPSRRTWGQSRSWDQPTGGAGGTGGTGGTAAG